MKLSLTVKNIALVNSGTAKGLAEVTAVSETDGMCNIRFKAAPSTYSVGQIIDVEVKDR